MGRFLDRIYDWAGYAAAAFMIGTLAFVLIGILGRVFGFHLRGTDAYAGYCMAACGFLALAHTLRKGEHIRVTLVLDHVPPHARRVLELACWAVGTVLAGSLAWFSTRLAWQSHAFNDISTANDATPLWIPQLAMAGGATLLAIAFLDSLVGAWREPPAAAAQPAAAEPLRME